MKKEWKKPEIKKISTKELIEKAKTNLTIESSLYASGCHQGMFNY